MPQQIVQGRWEEHSSNERCVSMNGEEGTGRGRAAVMQRATRGMEEKMLQASKWAVTATRQSGSQASMWLPKSLSALLHPTACHALSSQVLPCCIMPERAAWLACCGFIRSPVYADACVEGGKPGWWSSRASGNH